MTVLIELLGLPFIACIVMGAILGYCGMHVLKREVIFIDIALAQIAAVGAIIAHLAFDAEEGTLRSYGCSLLCVLLVSAVYALARRRIVQISIEAIIGISYAIAAAAALFLIGLTPGHTHANEMLAGSLLWIGWPDVKYSLIIFATTGFFFYIFRKPLRSISEDYNLAVTKGIKVVWWDFLFYVLVGIVITATVRIAGVIVVFTFLIIPATISALFATRWSVRMFVSLATSVIASLEGLLFAYYLDFSVGPSIAMFLGVTLIAAVIFRKLFSLNLVNSIEQS